MRVQSTFVKEFRVGSCCDLCPWRGSVCTSTACKARRAHNPKFLFSVLRAQWAEMVVCCLVFLFFFGGEGVLNLAVPR